MKIGNKTSINPLVFGGYTQKTFIEILEGRANIDELKAKHKECVSIYKKANPKKVVKKKDD